MSYWCSAFGCTNESGRPNPDDPAKKISFHKFPKDAVTRQRWIAATHRKNFDPGPHATLCSDHFANESFVPGLTRRNFIRTPFHQYSMNYRTIINRHRNANQLLWKSELSQKPKIKCLAVASNEDAPTSAAITTTAAGPSSADIHIDEDEISRLKKRISDLEKKVSRLQRKLKNDNGRPGSKK